MQAAGGRRSRRRASAASRNVMRLPTELKLYSEESNLRSNKMVKYAVLIGRSILRNDSALVKRNEQPAPCKLPAGEGLISAPVEQQR